MARGDERAFARLYDLHAPRVFGLACRMLGHREEAEDLLQEVFLAVWERAASYDTARGPVAAWVLVMTRSRALDRLRRRKTRQGREETIFQEAEGDLLRPLPEPGPPVLDRLATEEGRAELRRALTSLPEPQRRALEAAYMEGLTQQEIADKQGVPLGTVKTRMRLGLEKLMETLSTEPRP